MPTCLVVYGPCLLFQTPLNTLIAKYQKYALYKPDLFFVKARMTIFG